MAGEEWSQFEWLKAEDYVPEMKNVQNNLEVSFELAEAQAADNDAVRQKNAKETLSAMKEVINFSSTWAKKIKEIGEAREEDRRVEAQLFAEQSGWTHQARKEYLTKRGELFKEGEYIEKFAADLEAKGDDASIKLAAQLRGMNPAQLLALKEVSLGNHADNYELRWKQWLITEDGTDRIWVDPETNQEFSIHTATPEQFDFIQKEFDKQSIKSFEGARDSTTEFLQENYFGKVRRKRASIQSTWLDTQKATRIQEAKDDFTITATNIMTGEGSYSEKFNKVLEQWNQTKHRLGVNDPAALKGQFLTLIEQVMDDPRVTPADIVQMLNDPNSKVWTPGGEVQILQDKGWLKALGGENMTKVMEIIKRQNEKQKTLQGNIKLNAQTQLAAKADQLLNRRRQMGLSYLTTEDKEQLIKDFENEHPEYEGDYGDTFNNLLTQEEADEKAVISQMTMMRTKGIAIPESYLNKLSGENRKTWKKILDEGGGVGLTQTQYDESSAAAIQIVATEMGTTQTIALGTVSQLQLTNQAHATKFYSHAYKQGLIDFNGDENKAHQQAESLTTQYVKNLVEDPSSSNGKETDYVWKEGDVEVPGAEPFNFHKSTMAKKDRDEALDKRTDQTYQQAISWWKTLPEGEQKEAFTNEIIPGTRAQIETLIELAHKKQDGPLPELYQRLAHGRKDLTALDIANSQIVLLNAMIPEGKPKIPLFVGGQKGSGHEGRVFKVNGEEIKEIEYKPTFANYSAAYEESKNPQAFDKGEILTPLLDAVFN